MKKFILLILIIICTGCTATYEININNNNKIYEKLSIEETNTSIFDLKLDDGYTIKETYENIKSSNEFTSMGATIENKITNNKLELNYKKELDINKYLNSDILNQCYDNPTFEVTDEYFYIDSGVYFSCFEYYDYLDSLKIILKTNHKVLSNNADEIKNDKYIWNITKSNYEDKNIEIKLSMTEYKKSYTSIIITVIVFTILIIVGIIVLNILIRKMKTRNKI